MSNLALLWAGAVIFYRDDVLLQRRLRPEYRHLAEPTWALPLVAVGGAEAPFDSAERLIAGAGLQVTLREQFLRIRYRALPVTNRNDVPIGKIFIYHGCRVHTQTQPIDPVFAWRDRYKLPLPFDHEEAKIIMDFADYLGIPDLIARLRA